MLSFSNHKSDLVAGRAINGILYLAPHSVAGFKTVCASSSPGCRDACLYSAGRGAFESVQAARIEKTRRWFEDRGAFINDLEADIDRAIKRAKRKKLPLYIRLNGTSDLPALWTSLKRFSGINAYDYTKHPFKAYRKAIEQQHIDVNFSLDERDRWKVAQEYLEAGQRVAVVFDLKKSAPMIDEWRGVPVIDGDVSDLRPLDDNGVIVGLRAKGKARQDQSGFVFPVTNGVAIG